MLKKVLSLLLITVMVLGMGTNAFAVTSSDRVNDVIASIDFNGANKDYSEMHPGDVLVFPLTADMFSWNSGTAGAAKEAVTSSQLRGITVEYRETGSKKIIKEVKLDKRSVSGIKGTTQCVVVTFADTWNDLKTVDYTATIYLRYNRTRKSESEVEISGTFGFITDTIDSYDNYYAMEKGRAVETTEYIKDIELDLGNGLSLWTKMYTNRLYYGYAEENITEADDKMLTKYPEIITIYRVTAINLPTTGKVVQITGYPDCHVYNKDGKYLGSSNSKIEFSTIYYITEKKIDMGGGTTSDASSSTPSSEAPPEPESNSSNTSTPNNTTVITADSLNSLSSTAVSTAKSSGAKTAVVRVKDAKSVSADALRSMQKTVSASGLAGQLNADIMSGNSVSGRITINPANATNLTFDINLGVYTDSASTSAVKSKFDSWYTNEVQVISLAQKGSYGMTVNIAAKVNLSNIDTSKIRLYSYDTSTNKFKELTGTDCKVDKSGFLQFKTNVGNEIIVSSGALTRA